MLLLLSACAWEVPLDTGAAAPSGAISGSLVIDGVGEPGPGFVLLYEAEDPPPPEGVGVPVNLAAIAPDAFSGGGLLAGDFLLTGVPDGSYILGGLVDMDGDFQPLLTASAGATCGDVVGAHVTDLATGTPAEVALAGGELLPDVTVLAAVTLETERPAFTLVDGPAIDRGAAGPQGFQLRSTGISSPLIRLDDSGGDCPAVFLLKIADEDGDGLPDPHPTPELAAAGAYDIWPRIYLRYLGDRDVVAEAVISPAVALSYPVGVTTPVTELDVLYVPGAIEVGADGEVSALTGEELPAGSWSITAVNPTGQTWTLPNEVALYEALAGAPEDFRPEDQGAALVLE